MKTAAALVLAACALAACALPGRPNLASREDCAYGRAPAARCAIVPPGAETIFVRHE